MYKRNIRSKLERAFTFSPVVLLTGARQTGKTTLMREIAKEQGYSFITLDDIFNLSTARKDPIGFIEGLKKPVIIDEVQKAPEIFLPMKKDVDENRFPGRYALTGSANPLLLPQIGDSLAGRMSVLYLMPLSQGEILGRTESFIDSVFDPDFKFGTYSALSKKELIYKVLKGGFPEMQTENLEKQLDWSRSYLTAILQKDIRDLAQIDGIKEFPNLLGLLALRTGNLLNMADLGRACGIAGNTLKRYIHLLECLFLVHLQPSWRVSHEKRLTKAPKVYLLDTGFLNYLLNFDFDRYEMNPSLFGGVLESFVVSELRKQSQWNRLNVRHFHFRLDETYEVDIVLESGDGSVVGVEVKNSSTVHPDDLKGLRKLQEVAKSNFVRGVLLYMGTETYAVGKNLWVVPMSSLWEV